MRDLSIATEVVHAGERRTPLIGRAVATPIYASTTFTYSTMAELSRVFDGEGGDFVYTRNGNPTVSALEDAVACIENGKVGVAYGSGMAAIHAALMACEIQPGSVVLASQDLYGASFALLNKILAPLGITTVTTDFSDLNRLQSIANKVQPKILLAETISNPLLNVCDIEAVSEIAQSAGARLIVDNTFASPYLCRPLDHGADLTVHSATKYLGGHGDAMGGIVVSNKEKDRAALTDVMTLVGGILSPWEAHQILRGVKTLALRVERQCNNARILAETLTKNERIETVYYPTLSARPASAGKMLRAPFGGALVTLKLRNDTREAAYKFMDALQLCIRATSLGDVYTLVSHSASSSHRELSPQRRAELGITEGVVRISVGIEDIDDIIYDINAALSNR